MNLFELQEQLKGLPMQAVMSYANGGNPQVPPYIALTELNRRKQMETAAAAMKPQPQGTVADQVKMGVASLAGPQQEAMLPQASQGVPGFAGGGTPERRLNVRGVSQDVPESERVIPDALQGGQDIIDWLTDAGRGENDTFWQDNQNTPSGEALLKYFMRRGEVARNIRKSLRGEDQNARDQLLGRLPDTPNAQDTLLDRGSAAPQSNPRNASQAAPQGVVALAASKAGKSGKTASTQGAPAAAAPASSRADGLQALLEQLRPAKEKTPEELQQQEEALRNRYGIKDLSPGQAARLDAIEKIIAERNQMYQKSREGRGMDKTIQMLAAYSQAPRGQAFGAAANEGSKVRKENTAADLADADKRMSLGLKMAELRDLNEAKAQAFREGNLQRYLQLDAEQKAKAEAFRKEQLAVGKGVYKTERQAESHMEGIREQGRAARDVARIGADSRMDVAGVRAGAAGGKNDDAKYAALRLNAVKAVDAALAKDMMYKLKPAAEQEAIRERMIQQYMSTLAKPGETGQNAPTQSSNVVDWSNLKK